MTPANAVAALRVDLAATRRDPSLLSVLIPCRNGADVLGQQLESLVRQTYTGPLEVIVVENGSVDDTRAVAESFVGRIRGLRVIEVDGSAGKPGAVNTALGEVHGEKIVMVDADDTLDERFLAVMAAALDEHTFVGARLDSVTLNDEHIRRWRGTIHDDELTVMLNHLAVVGGGALGVRATAFEQVGGYDTRFRSNEDVDLSWRLQYAGHQPHFVPEAVVHYRYRSKPRQIFQQERAYAQYTALLYREHRRHGLPRRRVLSVLRAWAELVVALLGLATKAGRARLATRAGSVVGRLEGSVRYRVLYL